MPDNPYSSKAGNLTRCHQLLAYLAKHKEDLDVHFLSTLWWTEADKQRFSVCYPSIKLFIEELKSSKSNRIRYFFKDKLPKILKKIWKRNVVSKITPSFKKRFMDLHRVNQYDVIIISYAEYGELVEDIDTAYKIIDTHDFFSLQYLYKTDKTELKPIGRVFQEEMRILEHFNEIWTFSIEEEYIFNQFTGRRVQLIPLSFPQHILPSDRNCLYDVIYIASNNPHNINSITWFINEVLPLLPNIKIHIIGVICDHIADHPQLIKLGMVDDLSAIYENSKITICPMLSGTGIKIKVLESLSYGIPVVTSRRGVDGLVNKEDNGCLVAKDAASFAGCIIKLLDDEQHYVDISKQAIAYFSSCHNALREKEILDNTLLPKKSAI